MGRTRQNTIIGAIALFGIIGFETDVRADASDFTGVCAPLPVNRVPHANNPTLNGGWVLVDFCTDGATGSGSARQPDCHHNDDDSAIVTLPFQFSLYGDLFSQIYINNNGNLSFGQRFSTFTASGFPINGFPMVAPFWGDVDTGDQNDDNGNHNTLGHVWQQQLSPNTFAVTWDDVGYYNERGDRLSTFQVLISDGTNPAMGAGNNVCFCYDDMNWTTGEASSGIDGFGGVPATVGANRGNGADFFLIGRFDRPGTTYDGPGGTADGVDFLDGVGAGPAAPFCFNATGTNVAPIPVGFPANNTFVATCNVPFNAQVEFLAPEAAQTAAVTVTDLNNAVNAGLTIMNAPMVGMTNIGLGWTPSPSDVGEYTLNFSATDDGFPAQTTEVSATIRVDCDLQVQLTPDSSFDPAATTHTVTAQISLPGGAGLAGTTVTFMVDSGPNAGTSATAQTDAQGSAQFTYTTNGGIGVDVISASFMDPSGMNVAARPVRRYWDSDCQPNQIPDLCDIACNALPACGTDFEGCGAFEDANGDMTPDACNLPPVARCQNPTVCAPAGTCTADVDINDNSTDPDQDPLTLTQVPPAPYVLGNTNVMLTVDDGQSTAMCTGTVTVNDCQAPAITCPANLEVEADGQCMGTANPNATANDVCSNNVTVARAPAGNRWPVGVNTIDHSATDDSENGAGCQSTVTVVDRTAPTVTFLSNSVQAGAGPNAQVTLTLDAVGSNDNCGIVSYSWREGGNVLGTTQRITTTFTGTGVRTVSLTACDAGNNCTTRNIVVSVLDTVGPIVSQPQNITIEGNTTGGAITTFPTPTATDAVDPNPIVMCTPPSGSLFGLGSNTVTCNGRDGSGNVTPVTFVINVIDTTPPTLTTAGDLTVELNQNGGSQLILPVSATDIVDASPVITCTGAGTSQGALTGTYPVGTTQVTCTARDTAGNVATATFNVTVATNAIIPQITTPAPLTVEGNTTGGAIVTFPNPAVTDASDPNPSVTCVPSSGSLFPLGTNVVACTAQNNSGASSTATFVVNVVDTTPPVISPPPSIVLEANAPGGATPQTFVATAADIVDPNPMVSCTSSFLALGQTTLLCTATDASGNTSSINFTVTVSDTTAPNLGVSADITVEGNTRGGADVSYNPPTVTDAADPMASATCTPASGAFFALGTQTVVCQATDSSGNVATQSFNVTVVDTTPPTLTLPGDLAVEANQAGGANSVATQVAASDIVDANPTVTCTPNTTTFVLGTTTVMCTAVDQSGNRVEGSFDVTVSDSTAPTLTVSADITVEGNVPGGAIVDFTEAMTMDVGDSTPTINCDRSPGSFFPLGATLVTCSSTDASGNMTTATFTVTVVDTTPPTVTPASNITVEATQSGGTVVSYNPPTVTDIVDANPTVTCTPPSGSAFTVGTNTVECRASDASGNMTTSSFSIVIADTTPPVLNLSGTLQFEGNAPGGANLTLPDFTATDLGDPNPTVVCDEKTGFFPLGSTLVTCVATDASGNTATGNYSVVIVDTTAPTLMAPPNIMVEATSATGANVTLPTLTATDIVDANPTVLCTRMSGAFEVGTTTVRCTATDASANRTTITYTVTVTDSGAPTLTVPNNLTVEADTVGGADVTLPAIVATDLADPNPTVQCSRGSGLFPLGTTTVTCTATDNLGNTTTATFTVTVVDSTPPTLTVPARIVVEADLPGGANVTVPAATATDIVDPNPTVMCDRTSGMFVIGTTVVSCSATDASGNTATATFEVVVGDGNSPVLNLPANIQIEADQPGGATVTIPNVTATDAQDPNPTVTCDRGSGLFALGTTVVTCTARDSQGNETTGSFTVTVSDTTGPAINAPNDINVEGDQPGGANVTLPNLTATDAVDGSPMVVCDRTSGFFPLGTTVVTCDARDAANNRTRIRYNVIVSDTTAPTLNPQADLQVEGNTNGGANIVLPTIVATDTVRPFPTVTCDQSSGFFALGTTTVQCTATDSAGNSTSISFDVVVVDTTAPTLPTLADQNIEGDTVGGANVNLANVAITDIVDPNPTIVCDRQSGVFPLGRTTVTCTARDASGNEATATFNINVLDTTPPTLTTAGDVAVDADASGVAQVQYTAASATDIVDANPVVTCTPAPGAFNVGMTTVACTATDASGNSTRRTFVVTVRDVTPPMIQMLPDQPIETESNVNGGANVTLPGITATDGVDGGITVVCDQQSGFFPVGQTTVTCTATDNAGNSVTQTFVVNVEDTVAPTITHPGDVEIEGSAQGGSQVTLPNLDVTDAGDDTPTVMCDQQSGFFPVGETTVTCTATDDAGNASTITFLVRVVDSTPPVIASGDIQVEANAPGGANVTLNTVGVTDLVDPNPMVTCDPPSGFFPLGTTMVMCTATDASGNASVGTFTVTVVDTMAPSLVAPMNIEVEGDTVGGAMVTLPNLTATDSADGMVMVTCDQMSGLFAVGVTTVTCVAVDSAGNMTAVQYTVTVNDSRAPALGLDTMFTLEGNITGGATFDLSGTATATDVVDGILNIRCEPAGDFFPLGNTRVSCSATDAAGNTQTVNTQVMVVDTTPPTLSVPRNLTVECTDPTATAEAIASFARGAAAADIVDASPTISSDLPDTLPVGETTVTFTATDQSNNRAMSTAVLAVTDTTPPDLSTLPDKVEIVADAKCAQTAILDTSFVVEGCGDISYEWSEAGTVLSSQANLSAAITGLGAHEITVRACDERNNCDERTITVTLAEPAGGCTPDGAVEGSTDGINDDPDSGSTNDCGCEATKTENGSLLGLWLLLGGAVLMRRRR